MEKLNGEEELLIKKFDGEKLLADVSPEMFQATSSITAVARKSYIFGYYDSLDTIKEAIKWFKETHNTVYIMYDEGSLDHLINLYNEAKANK